MKNTEALKTITEDMKSWSVIRLANEADTRHDNDEAGNFLIHVRDNFLEAVERFDSDEFFDALTTGESYEVVEVMDYDGTLHEIADGAPDIYTSTRWAEFHGLGAYLEGDDDGLLAGYFESKDADMTGAAGIVLYSIAHRFLNRLAELLAESYAEAVEDEDGEA